MASLCLASADGDVTVALRKRLLQMEGHNNLSMDHLAQLACLSCPQEAPA
jgi:hypothetical protein